MLISKTIDSALRKISVLSGSDEASPADHILGLDTLNRIIDSYNTQNLLITHIEDIELQAPFTANECESADPEDFTERLWKSSVTIGHCQEINMEAPVDIQGLFWRQNGTDYQSTEMSMNEWAGIDYKETTSIPYRHYIQRIDNNNIKIYFDVIPQEGLLLHLQAKMPYTGKNSTGNDYCPTDDINWNFGFEKMLMYRLAIELSPDFEVPLSPIITALAQDAESNVKTHNYQPRTLKSDSTLSKGRRRSGSRRNRARY